MIQMQLLIMEPFTQRMLKRAQLWREQQSLPTFSNFPDRRKLIAVILSEEEQSSSFNIFKHIPIFCEDQSALTTRPPTNMLCYDKAASFSTKADLSSSPYVALNLTDRKVEYMQSDIQHRNRCTITPEQCKQILNSKEKGNPKESEDSTPSFTASGTTFTPHSKLTRPSNKLISWKPGNLTRKSNSINNLELNLMRKKNGNKNTGVQEERKNLSHHKNSSQGLNDNLKQDQEFLHCVKNSDAEMIVNKIPKVCSSKNISIRIGKEVLLAEEICEIEDNKDDINEMNHEIPYKIEPSVQVAQGEKLQSDSSQLRYSVLTSTQDHQHLVERLKLPLCMEDTSREAHKHPVAVDQETHDQQIQNLYEEVLKHHILRRQCSKAVAICKSVKEFSSSPEYLEAERFLLLFSLKEEAAEQEMYNLQNAPLENVSTVLGTLNFETISFSLSEHFLRSILCENYEYWFVCVGVHNTDVLATQASTSIQEGEICFAQPLCFKKLPHSFSIKLMLFYMKLKKHKFSHEVKYHIPKEKKQHKFPIHFRHSRSSLYLVEEQALKTPNNLAFKLIATKTLRVSNIGKAFYVDEVKIPNIIQGNMYLQLNMDIALNINHTGFLDIMEEHKDVPTWERYWCRLSGYIFSYWKYPSDEDIKDPEGNVDLRASCSSKVEPADKYLCLRSRTLLLVTGREPLKEDCDSILMSCKPQSTLVRHLWSAANLQELTQWCTQINRVLSILQEWHMLKTATLNQEIQITTVL